MVGTSVSHYRVLATLGMGGMGTVYLAEDIRLSRKVALKFVSEETLDAVANARLRREARAASALDHPNIATVYEIDDWDGRPYIAMAYYPGESLRERLGRVRLTIAEAASFAAQISSALEAAHAAGIVHRDLKPANIMIADGERLKLVDFGLARVIRSDVETESRLTELGTAPGTLAYMAPEQLRGADPDTRVDVWAFGVVLYEMLSGRHPFESSSSVETMAAIASAAATPVSLIRPDTPRELTELVSAALIKDRAARSLTMSEAATTCAACAARLSGPARQISTTRRIAVSAATLLIAAAALIGWLAYREQRIKWAREVALPQIAQLLDTWHSVAAFDLAHEAAREIPSDPELVRLLSDATQTVKIDSVPPSAQISYREYGAHTAAWRLVGRTPLSVDAPNTVLEWKADLAGFVTAEDVGPVRGDHLRFVLQPLGAGPAGMVLATLGSEPFELLAPQLAEPRKAVLGDFLIDRFEVTNREFKQFVDAHGYQRAEFWREPFMRNGVPIPRAEAMRLFVDTAGRPGPAAWEAGQYRAGEDAYPVTGISWYEAAAYAAFVGKSLPTVFHWSAVADPVLAPWVVPTSNIGRPGLRPVGASGGISRFGTADMAGNAKEWVWNSADPNTRYILGGAWNEPGYMFVDADARSPFDRDSTFGFRCMKPFDAGPPSSATMALVPSASRDFTAETRVTEDVFRSYAGMYSYDNAPLQPRLESVDDSNSEWTLENVSLAAAYGNERLIVHVFRPKHTPPPYQTLVLFPGAGAIFQKRFDPTDEAALFSFIVTSGRLLVVPTLKGTYERRSTIVDDVPNMTVSYRDHVVMWMKDLGRTLDYLESRSDVQKNAVGYLGFSWGAAEGPIAMALQPRLRLGILVGGGFPMQRALPEAEAFSFAPYVSAPVLMINGRLDVLLSPHASQEPMFQSLGTPASRKRQVLSDSGHVPRRADIVKESLEWIDRYFGPVR